MLHKKCFNSMITCANACMITIFLCDGYILANINIGNNNPHQ